MSRAAGGPERDDDAALSIRRLRLGALLLALLMAVGMPTVAAYYRVQAIEQKLEEEAEQLADRISGRVSVAPTLWMFEQNALNRLIGGPIHEGTISAGRIVDAQGKTVLSVGPWIDRPWFEHASEIFDSGVAIGRFEAQHEHRSLVTAVMQIAAVSMLLALALYLLVARVAVASIARAVERLKAARFEAERAGQARAVFLATMSHEIRTPMNGVIGMTSLLRDTALDERQRHYVETIRGSGDALLRVINDILDFSKVESGHVMLEEDVFQPEVLGDEVRSLLEPLARDKGLQLRYECAPGLPAWVRADVNRLRQVLVNLLGNAIKFSERGCVRLHIGPASPGHLRFEVEDEGIGMTAEQMRSIFDPFVQADASTSRRFGGTGLGLAITRRLVELMGGSIEAQSVAGRGSRFTVELPAPAGAAPPTDTHASGFTDVDRPAWAERPLSALRLLVAEDNAVNATVITALLARLGLTAVDCVGNGLEAVEAVQRQRYDAVLMDVSMPELDGLEATRRIRADATVSQPWIIALTANVMADDQTACLDAGMNDFLGKPVRREVLQRQLEALAERLSPEPAEATIPAC